MCRVLYTDSPLSPCHQGHGLAGCKLVLSSKDSILPAEVRIFANNISHPLTSDPLCIPSGEAMYQEHVEISYLDSAYRIIGTSASVRRVLQSPPTLSPLYVVNDWYV